MARDVHPLTTAVSNRYHPRILDAPLVLGASVGKIVIQQWIFAVLAT